MQPLQDNFREGAPISQVPASWFNAVAKFINSLIPGYGISWMKSESSNIIEVDPDVLGGAGTVKSVNSISPDANGDVDLGNIVYSVNNATPDANGNVTINIPVQTVVSVDHKSPDQQGNIQLNAICTINGHNGDSVGNFSGVATSVNGEVPDVNGNVDLGDLVYFVNGNAPDANGDVDLGDIVNSVDGHSPDANGAVSFGLTASKWMKTDASGHIATSNETPIALPSGYTGQDSTITVVTDVTWNGTTLQKKTRQLTFKSGVLTTVGSETTSTIDTPVAYSP